MENNHIFTCPFSETMSVRHGCVYLTKTHVNIISGVYVVNLDGSIGSSIPVRAFDEKTGAVFFDGLADGVRVCVFYMITVYERPAVKPEAEPQSGEEKLEALIRKAEEDIARRSLRLTNYVRDRLRQAYNTGYDQGYADANSPVVEESRIVPGDEVECKNPSDILVTIQVDYDNDWLTGINRDGEVETYGLDYCKKTGHHHDGYDTLIKQMRGEYDG